MPNRLIGVTSDPEIHHIIKESSPYKGKKKMQGDPFFFYEQGD